MLRKLALAALLFGLAGTAGAADEKKKKNAAPTPEVMFGRLDANGDKKLSLNEFKNISTELAAAQAKPNAKKPGKAAPALVPEEVFKRLDTNSDKALTVAEFKFLAEVIAPPETKKKKKK